MALAISGKANCHKDQGRLDEAVETYIQASKAAPRDPTFVFNLAQAYEYVQNYLDGISCIERLMDTVKPGEMNTVNHFAIPLLHLKLLFVAGPDYHHKLQRVCELPCAYVSVCACACVLVRLFQPLEIKTAQHLAIPLLHLNLQLVAGPDIDTNLEVV